MVSTNTHISSFSILLYHLRVLDRNERFSLYIDAIDEYITNSPWPPKGTQ